MKKTVLIMAGGRGERFWPKSRKRIPKQFLTLIDDSKTMIQITVKRLLPLVDISDIYIITNKDYEYLVHEQLPDLPMENILIEPVGRNTAPCIGLGTIHILMKYSDALMIVLPSDHLIRHNELFIKSINEACDVAEQDENLVTIGITPSYPEPGFGYVKLNMLKTIGHSYAVEKFIEKPSIEVAQKFVLSDDYLWNSGMFIWKASTILKSMQRYMPIMYGGLLRIKDAFGTEQKDKVLEKEYLSFPSESIDYGIIEKAENIYTIHGTFVWDDVGSWLAVRRIKKSNECSNVLGGNVITLDTNNCIIEGATKLIVAIGLTDLVIVDSDDVTLICKNDNVGDIKKIVENLKTSNRTEYI